MKCPKCFSERIANVGAKCSDMFNAGFGDTSYQGYVLSDMGIGGGDYLELDYCMDCGQILGTFPLPTCELEKDLSDEQVVDFFNDHFIEGQRIETDYHRQFEYCKAADQESMKLKSFLREFFSSSRDINILKAIYPSAQKFLEMYRNMSSFGD